MAAVMQAPHITHAHTVPLPTRSQPQGILLNPSPSARYCPLPSLALDSFPKPAQHSSTQSLASTSSSSSASPSPSSSATNTPPPSMPHDTHLTPRALALANRARSGSAPAGRRIRFAPLPDPRAEEEELDDDGIPSHTPSRSESSDSLPTPECSTLLLPDTPTPSASSLATFTLQASPLPKRNPSPCFPHAPANTTLAKKLFRPFLLRNPPSADQPPGLGLFKTGSRESSRSRTDEPCSSWGAPLGRWTSESAVEKTRRGSTSSSKSAPAPDVASAPATPRRTTRLLNGRVYGGRRKKRDQGNAFANAKDEDEFVEWGYGGMGSVRAGAGVWSRLQSDQKVVVGALEGERGRSIARPATAPAAASGDGDDGSGMAWVRKRREERERERKAREEKAKAGEVVEEKAEVPVTAEPEEIVVAPPAGEEKGEGEQHVHTAVSVPAPYYRPHHHARTLSMEGNGATPTPSRQSTAEGKAALPEAPAPALVVPEPEEEEDEESEEDDEDEEEEVDDEEQHRKTALGAGVEIVGRHAHHRE